MSHSAACNAFILKFALLLLVLPALMPRGLMLAVDQGSHQVEITICSGFAPRTVLMDLATGEIADPLGQFTTGVVTADTENTQDHVDTDPCAFSLLAQPSLTTAYSIQSAPDSPTHVCPAARNLALVNYCRANLPARGPPPIAWT